MDATAITFCMEKGLPIVVFDLLGDGNIRSLLEGRRVGTLVADRAKRGPASRVARSGESIGSRRQAEA